MDKGNKVYWQDLAAIAVVKLLAHVMVNSVSVFGLHRDEYLYLAEADHLDWGFMEVPPLTPFIGWITKGLLGSSEVAVRFPTAMLGAISILVIGMMVKEMGGKRIAQAVAGIGFLLSPVFLGSNNLFQPVSFNQFWWLLLAYFSVRVIKEGWKQHWIPMGIVTGLSILTKYSVVFFIVALLGGLVLTRDRRLLMDKYLIYSMSLALLICAPNIFWQISHDFPVVNHMTTLASTQLVNMSIPDFIVPQVLFHFGCSLIWIPGLVFVFWDRSMQKYRYLGLAYILVFLLVMALDGKTYYIFGAYSTMFALGGMAWERWLGKWALAGCIFILLLNLPIYPFSLPLLSPEAFKSYAGTMKDKLGVDAPLRWEDGKVREMNQDFADMLGWEEIPEKVARFYHQLPDDVKQKIMIQGGSYGHAGVLSLRREKYNLPEIVSLNSGFIAWAPDTVDFDRQILVDDRRQDTSTYFNSVVLIDSISDPNARDPGYIYYRSDPKMDVRQAWIDIVRTRKEMAGIKK